MRSARLVFACLCVLLSSSILVGSVGATSPKERLQQKRAQARSVLAQVSALDRRFEASVEAWNGAKLELARARSRLRSERNTLRIAKHQDEIAVARVRARVVALYEGSDPTTIEVILGSATLSDILDRIETANAVAASDHRLAAQTAATRARYTAAVARTAALERRRAATVTQLESQRGRIGTMLTKRRQLLSSVQTEVTKLQAEEAQRQARLAAEARARLAREEALLRRRAAEAAAAAAAQRAADARRAHAAAAATATARPPAETVPAQTTQTQTATTGDPAATDPAPPPALPTTTAPAPATTTTAPAPTASPGAGHPQAATIALRYLGVKYVWGGATPAGFDCSGLVMYVYAQLGIQLPHYAAAQFGFGAPVARDQLQPGDLVFFDALNHVGIYIGGGQMVHAPETGDVVKITPLSQFGSYVGARRI